MRGPSVVSDPELLLLQQATTSLASNSTFDVTFGGLTTSTGAALSSFVGTIGRSLHGLVVESGEGLGGQAIQMRRPVFAMDYARTRSITHRYGKEVAAERIVTVVAVPVLVDNTVRAVIYGGYRSAVQPGGEIVGYAAKVARALSWELSVHDEVERRLIVMESERIPWTSTVIDRQTARDQYAELRGIAQQITDPGTRERLDRLGEALIGRPTEHAATLILSPREIDAISLVALGLRNSQVAARLGLRETTIKAYVASAMRKLHASSRFEAVVKARIVGLIP